MTTLTLDTLRVGQKATIIKFNEFSSQNELATRLMEMGMTLGSHIEIVHEAPFGGAIAVRCRESLIAIRTGDAALIEVCLS